MVVDIRATSAIICISLAYNLNKPQDFMYNKMYIERKIMHGQM